jgi:hypothetical protein
MVLLGNAFRSEIRDERGGDFDRAIGLLALL